MESTVGLSANGEPAIVQDETKVDVSFHLQPGSLIVTQDGKAFEAYHASVEFVDVHDHGPWLVDTARFTAKGPDGKSVVLSVDLLNDTYDGPRAGVPAAIWKVVALAATTAGDIGLTYATPDPRPM
ncbi:hypothetical protein ACFC1D_04185 [Streptomyces vinaceus]|uniref:hypothetical protein n=1 Tax=Streptomyces vinaceus TaxID=1960 RepID=UPI0035DA7EFC